MNLQSLIVLICFGLFSSNTVFGQDLASTEPISNRFESISINVDGLTREYYLYKPRSSRASAKRPLVIVLHGGGGTAKHMISETGESFTTLADDHGFYLVYPNAVNKMWDFGAGKVSEELDPRIDDRTYFKRVMDDVIKNNPIDAKRVFASGISRGGQASYFLACEFPDRIRAIAPVAMPLPEFLAEKCRSGPAVGVAIMNGTADRIVPYKGGMIVAGKKERGLVLSTSQTVALWNKRNGCIPASAKVSRINTAKDRMYVKKTAWQNCSGAPVILYKIVGGGHTWPSGSQYLPAFVVGRVNKDINAAEVAWKFFSSF